MTGGAPGDPPLPQPEDFLTRIPLFAEIDRVALAQLAAHLDPVVLAEGETVCRQGEPGDCLYVVAAGRLGVHLHDPDGEASRWIDGLGPGDFFGEMALLTGEPRSATVRAETPSRVLRLDRERFAGVEPWAVTIALLATSVAWFFPFQTSSYMVARAASEDRLFSHEQARRFALAYADLTLLGLALAVPYWRLIGVL